MNRFAKVFALLMLSSWVSAASFLFSENGVERIAHPVGYTGSQSGTISATVCLANSVPAEAEVAIRNAILAINTAEPRLGNVVPASLQGIPSNRPDFESVLLHELGHCIGLDHSALGPSELAGRPPSEQDALIYSAIATAGSNSSFQLSSNVDGVRGSRDDQRGDDVNRHWYRRNVNNPFAIDEGVIDRSTYSRATSFLPAGHSYIELASSFSPCAPPSGTANTSALRGQQPTQSVMFPVLCTNNVIRDVAPSDVATLRLAGSGASGSAAQTTDNYQLQLNYLGYAPSCNIRIEFVNNAGFALCSVSANISGNNVFLASASARFQDDVNWWFNQEPRSDQIFASGFEQP